jgi:hypothetical protein
MNNSKPHIASDDTKPEVTVERSEAGDAWVVYIDSHPYYPDTEEGPTCLRVYLNDEPIFENPPYGDPFDLEEEA